MCAESASHDRNSQDAIDAARASRLASSLVSPLAGIIGCILLFCLSANVSGYGQGSGQELTGRPADLEGTPGYGNGKAMDDYMVQQSVELGGRITNVNGSSAMFDTLLNEQTGPRLLQQQLMIRPTPQAHAPFDDFYLESFSWGGDPSNAARLRVNKHGLYNFNAGFRRDENFFDYDLLANPLNPSVPAVNFSPHSMFLTRRLYDFDLVLLPQRRFSFRLGFSRNRNGGPSFSSDHQGTEALLDQRYSTTEDAYRLGASWRALPRTTLSFNETLQFLKNDTDQILSPTNTILSPNAGTNTVTAYSRTMRYRNFLPTEQLSLTSSSIRHVDIAARFVYSNADANTPLNENFSGLISRTGVQQLNTSGTTAHARWVSEEADGGITIHLAPHVRLVDSFRFYAYRIPGALALLQNNFFATYTASSPADVQNDLFNRFVQQSIKSNEFALQYDVSRHLGVRAGYLYRNIFDGHHWLSTAIGDIFSANPTAIANCLGQGGTLNPDGTCTVTGAFDSENEPVTINQHTAIAGAWFRMAEKFRADAEVRLMSADNYLTRIDPRREQQYRANLSFTPQPWLTLAANVKLREQRNNTQDFAYKAHIRNFGFNVIASPNNRLTIETAYNYTSTGQSNNICYATTATPALGSFTCINDSSLQEVLGFYSNHTHYGSANVVFKPVRRVSAAVGYSVINVDGDTLILNALQPLGPLSFRYDQPLAFLGVEVSKQVELRAGWNYYQYNENSFVGPTALRYFHANLTTLSVRYAF